MRAKTTTLFILDMTCKACEARIAIALKAVDGVISVDVSLSEKRAVVEFDESTTTIEALRAAIEKAGYTVGKAKTAGSAIAIGIGLILAALYLAANAAGIFNAFPSINSSLGYGMLFVVGLLTSVHCVAMCGGIALSQSIAGVLPEEGKFKRLLPGLLYNGGRVVSYTIVGGLAGALGSAFSFSPVVKGIIAAAAGIFMVLFGLKMLGIFSRLPRFSWILPANLRKSFGDFATALRKRGPFAVGILNSLMPCGPLQTMQLYALGTGSLVAGALSMFIFSVGTVPLLLAFSFAAAFIPRKLVPLMVKASAVLVMFLGLLTLGRAASLSGISFPGQINLSASPSPSGAWNGAAISGKIIKAAIEGGVQTVTTDFGSTGYYLPFTVQAGIPVKWTIKVTADGLNGCNNPITVPSYGIKKTLVPGDNLIEFTPLKEGQIVYTCWMGMISSRITVVGDLVAVKAPTATARPTPSEFLATGRAGAGAIGLGGCCSGQAQPGDQ